MDQVKLQRLTMTEISGVDDPANQLPGWMVTKARARADLLSKVREVVFRPRRVTAPESVIEKAVAEFGLATVLVADGSVEVVKVAGNFKKSAAMHAVETLRKALGSDEAVIEAVRPGSVLFAGADGTLSVLRKAVSHDGRRHPDSGKFAPMAGPIRTKALAGMTVEHGGNVHPAIRRLAGMRTLPTGAPSGGGADPKDYHADQRKPSNPGGAIQ